MAGLPLVDPHWYLEDDYDDTTEAAVAAAKLLAARRAAAAAERTQGRGAAATLASIQAPAAAAVPSSNVIEACLREDARVLDGGRKGPRTLVTTGKGQRINPDGDTKKDAFEAKIANLARPHWRSNGRGGPKMWPMGPNRSAEPPAAAPVAAAAAAAAPPPAAPTGVAAFDEDDDDAPGAEADEALNALHSAALERVMAGAEGAEAELEAIQDRIEQRDDPEAFAERKAWEQTEAEVDAQTSGAAPSEEARAASTARRSRFEKEEAEVLARAAATAMGTPPPPPADAAATAATAAAGAETAEAVEEQLRTALERCMGGDEAAAGEVAALQAKLDELEKSPPPAPSEAELNAMQDNQKKNGAMSYYYAHNSGKRGPEWDGNSTPRLLKTEAAGQAPAGGGDGDDDDDEVAVVEECEPEAEDKTVMVNYREGPAVLHMTLKIKLPRKWLDGPVSNIMSTFVSKFNKKNAKQAAQKLDVKKLRLETDGGDPIPPDGSAARWLVDGQQLHVKKGRALLSADLAIVKEVDNFQFKDDGDIITLYVPLAGVGAVEKDSIVFKWKKRKMLLQVKMPEGIRYQLLITRLFDEIEDAEMKQKANKLVIVLYKVVPAPWMDVRHKGNFVRGAALQAMIQGTSQRSKWERYNYC